MKTYILTFKGVAKERYDNALKNAKELNAEVFIGGTDSIKNLTDICKLALDSEQDLLLLEDDVKLCSNIQTKINEYINIYKDTIINFFYNNKSSKTERLLLRNFMWSQCVYIPLKYLKIIIDKESWFRELYPYYIRTKQHDIFIGYCLMNKGYFISVKPCLVQHLNFVSSIDPKRSINRQSNCVDISLQ